MRELTSRVPGAQGARRVLQLLFYFDGRHPDATVEELASAVGVPVSTAYRYVALLRDLSILEEGASGTYHVTPRVLALGDAVESSHGLIRSARPVLRRLMHLSGETTLLVRLMGHAAVCVDRVESVQPMRLTYEPGQAVSLQQGASARLLIASLPREDRETHLDWLTQQDPTFAQRRAQFEAEIDRSVADGWAISHGEIDAGIVAVAAPVQIAGRTVAAISIAGPAFRVADGDLDKRREAVIEGANEIASAFLGRHPRSDQLALEDESTA